MWQPNTNIPVEECICCRFVSLLCNKLFSCKFVFFPTITVVTLQIFEFYMVVNKIGFDISVINNEVINHNAFVIFFLISFLASSILIYCLYPGEQIKQKTVSLYRYCSPVWCYACALVCKSSPPCPFHSQSSIQRFALTRLQQSASSLYVYKN